MNLLWSIITGLLALGGQDAPVAQPPPDAVANEPRKTAVHQASPSAPTRAREERTRILVLDIKTEGVAPEVARTVGRLIAARLGRREGVDVIAAHELREMVAFEAQRVDLGCDEQGCLAEIAGALGADVVFFGSLGALGDLTVLSLGGFDAHRGAALARETVEVDRIEDLPKKTAPAVDRLVARALGGEPPTPDADKMASTLFIGGAAATATGVLVAAGGGLVVAFTLPETSRPGASFTEVEAAKDMGRTALVVGLAGAVVATIGVVCAMVALAHD